MSLVAPPAMPLEYALAYRARLAAHKEKRRQSYYIEYHTPTLLYARITHLQTCTINRAAGEYQGKYVGVLGAKIRICPHVR